MFGYLTDQVLCLFLIQLLAAVRGKCLDDSLDLDVSWRRISLEYLRINLRCFGTCAGVGDEYQTIACNTLS